MVKDQKCIMIKYMQKYNSLIVLYCTVVKYYKNIN